jgi:alanine racemase
MTFPSETMRAWVDVDLAALVANARTVARIGGSRLLPMVKANGYGLGAVEVARALEAVEPWGFGVASADEGETLRAAGITRPLLVVTPLFPEAIQRYLDHDLRPSTGDPAALQAWTTRSQRPFHLEIDTGMSRAGVRWNDRAALDQMRSTLATAAGWEGVYTHFLAAESDPATTDIQWTRFQEIIGLLPKRPSLVHAANSAAALRWPCYAGDLVRPGIYLYGGDVGQAPPRPVAALRARVVAVRTLRTGDTVGYGGTWCADRDCTVATLSVGYADGFPRSGLPAAASTSRRVELNDRLAQVVGPVTMDMCMVRVDGPVSIGDVCTVYGGSIALEAQAESAGTISYELLTRIGPRVARRYRS